MDGNRSRFREKLKQDVKDNLRRYVSNRGLVDGDGKVSIPWIDIPRFKHKPLGGVSQGEGGIGDILGGSPGSDGKDAVIETEVTIDEVAEILAEELELPFRKSQKGDFSEVKRTSYKKIARRGVIKNFKRSYLASLARQMTTGTYDQDNPVVTLEKDDFRYKKPQIEYDPKGQAVIILMMDISGSMKELQKRLCRTQARWIEKMVRRQYPTVDVRFVTHSSYAKETDEHEFYHVTDAGGTVISSAYKFCDRLIKAEYSPDEWDIYPFHFTDGDNQESDNDTALAWLEQRLLPKSAAFCYGQCPSAYTTSGELFLEHLVDYFDLSDGIFSRPTLRLAKIDSENDHIEVLRTFLNEKASPLYNVLDDD